MIVIIALLLGILVPTLQGVRNRARAVVCRAHLKQWGTVLALYVEDNDGWIPAHGEWRLLYWFFRGSWMKEGDPNRPPVYHDLNTKGIACCPMAVKLRQDTEFKRNLSYITIRGPTFTFTYPGSTFRAWEIVDPLPRFHGSYGFNSTSTQGPSHWNRRWKVETHFVKGRANIPVILDCTSWAGTHRNNEPPPPWEGARENRWFCINRHNGYINGLFLDWSVRRIGLKEWWTLKWDEHADTAGPWTKAGGVQPEDWPEWMRHFKDY